MEKNTEFMNFCNNEYAKKLLKSFSSIVNYAEAFFKSSDDILNEKLRANLKNNSNDNNIPTNNSVVCIKALDDHANISGHARCILLRIALLCDAILNENPVLHQICVSSYLKNFASNCKRILGNKCEINVVCKNDFIFSSFRELLDIIILHFIRKAYISAADSKDELAFPIKFDLSACIINEIPEITIDTNVQIQDSQSDNIDIMDFFSIFSKEITETIADKLGIKTEPGTKHLTIKFPASSADDNIIVEQSKKQLINDGNSRFSIMLGDL